MSAAVEWLAAARVFSSPLAEARRNAARRRRMLLKALEWLVLALVALAILFPIAWMALTALKPAADV